MPHRLKKALRVSLALLSVSVLAYFVAIYWEDIHQLFWKHPELVAVSTALSMAAITCQSINFRLISGLESRLSTSQVGSVWAYSQLVNYVAPFQGGAAARIAMLRASNIPIREASSATLVQAFGNTQVGLGFGCLALLTDAPEAWVFGSLCAGCLLILLGVRLTFRAYGHHVDSVPVRFIAGILNEKRLRSLSVNALFVAQYLIFAANFLVLYRVSGSDLGMTEAVVLAAVTIIGALISLTPNNIGIQEAIIVYVGSLTDISVTDGLAVAMVARIGHVLAALLLLMIFGWLLGHPQEKGARHKQ